jgi:hypothetical protein
VRGEQHRASLADQLADQLPKLENAGRVKPVHRLVQDQQLGVRQQATRDAEALAHAKRIRVDAVISPRREPNTRQRAVDPPVRAPLPSGCMHPQVLAPSQMRVKARLLDDCANASECRSPLRG